MDKHSEKQIANKGQLKVAFKMLLTTMIDTINSNCSHAGSDAEKSTVDCYTNLLLKEVSIRTPLR